MNGSVRFAHFLLVCEWHKIKKKRTNERGSPVMWRGYANVRHIVKFPVFQAHVINKRAARSCKFWYNFFEKWFNGEQMLSKAEWDGGKFMIGSLEKDIKEKILV